MLDLKPRTKSVIVRAGSCLEGNELYLEENTGVPGRVFGALEYIVLVLGEMNPKMSPNHEPVQTNMLSLGATAPNFENLVATDGKRYSLDSFKDVPILAVVFSCNHCPYVKDYEDRMIEIQGDYAPKGVKLVAIKSNDEKSYPDDSYPEMVKRAKLKGFNFVYLRDTDQSVVDAYGAVCTPHVFLFDAKRALRYRGRIDDSRDPSKVKSQDLRNAIDELLAGSPVRVPDTRPFGCSIKFSNA